MIEQSGKNTHLAEPLIDPDTVNEVKKTSFISAPYFLGLSESFKQLFNYTHIQVCFKGHNTIKSMLMHPKDKINTQKGHPLPKVDQFKVIDQKKSQIAREAKEAIHIRKADPGLNRNVGKMGMPQIFDSILGIKPRNPCISLLFSQENRSEDMDRALTPFHSYIDKRMARNSTRSHRARNFNSN